MIDGVMHETPGIVGLLFQGTFQYPSIVSTYLILELDIFFYTKLFQLNY